MSSISYSLQNSFCFIECWHEVFYLFYELFIPISLSLLFWIFFFLHEILRWIFLIILWIIHTNILIIVVLNIVFVDMLFDLLFLTWNPEMQTNILIIIVLIHKSSREKREGKMVEGTKRTLLYLGLKSPAWRESRLRWNIRKLKNYKNKCKKREDYWKISALILIYDIFLFLVLLWNFLIQFSVNINLYFI